MIHHGNHLQCGLNLWADLPFSAGSDRAPTEGPYRTLRNTRVRQLSIGTRFRKVPIIGGAAVSPLPCQVLRDRTGQGGVIANNRVE